MTPSRSRIVEDREVLSRNRSILVEPQALSSTCIGVGAAVVKDAYSESADQEKVILSLVHLVQEDLPEKGR